MTEMQRLSSNIYLHIELWQVLSNTVLAVILRPWLVVQLGIKP